LNPSTGVEKSIALFGDIDVLGGISGYDSVNNVLWIEAALKDSIFFLRIDVATGAVTQVQNPLNLETMDFDPVSGLFYGVGLKVESSSRYYRVFVSLDSKNSNFTILANIDGYFIISAAQGALDIENRKYYSLLQPITPKNAPFQLVEFDMNTLKVSNHPQIGGNQCDKCPWSIHFSN